MDITQAAIEQTLSTEDIEGLLGLGAPGDEYFSEAKSIMSALAGQDKRELTEDDVASVVRAVWIRSFGPFSDRDLDRRSPAFRQVAHRILKAQHLTVAITDRR